MRRIVLLLASMALAVIFGSGVALADSPTTKEDCKNGGYAKYGFKNQGQCIKAVNYAPPADTTAPDTTIDNIDTSNLGTDRSVVTRFSSNEANSTFECKLVPLNELGEEIAIPIWEPCTSPKTFEDLGWYSYRFYVRATDAAGNVDQTPAAQVFDAKVDTVAPDASITSGPAEGETVNTDSVSFGWEVTDLTLATVGVQMQKHVHGGNQNIVPDHGNEWVYGVGPTVNPVSFSNLEDGTYTFTLVAEDKGGNQTRTERTFTVATTPDTTAPQVSFESNLFHQDGSGSEPGWYAEELPVVFHLSSNEENVTFECQLLSGWTEIPSVHNHDWRPCNKTVSYDNLETGLDGYVFNFQARAIDQAGNVTNEDEYASVYRFMVVTYAPQTTIDSAPQAPVTDDSVSIGFSSDKPIGYYHCHLLKDGQRYWDSGSSQPADGEDNDGSCGSHVIGSGASSSTKTLTGLPAGEYTFKVQGNISVNGTEVSDPSPPEVYFTVAESMPPETYALGGPGNDERYTDVPWGFFVLTKPENLSVEYRACYLQDSGENCTGWQPYSNNTKIDFEKGHVRAEFRAIGASDQVDPTPATRTFYIGV